MSGDRYNEIVQDTKEAREEKRNGISLSAKDYRRLKRFDVISIGDNEKLIHATEESHSEIKYYCRIEEMFDIIESAHHKLGHKKEKAMEVELKRKYCNIAREIINAYLNLCQPCALKKKAKGKGVVVKSMVMSDCELNSRCQIDLIDMQTEPDRDYKFILNY
ncbi:KRAB-A domain-containing protein 2 [Formica fusca]